MDWSFPFSLPLLRSLIFALFLVIFGIQMSVWDSLTFDDLPNEDLKWVAKTLGLDVAKRIWKRFAGNHVACPSRMTPNAVRRYMADNCEKTVHQLAFETGVSERTIYRYLNFVPKKRDNGQMSLF